MSWETGVLGEICDVRDGTHDSPKYQSEGIPLVTSKNLINGSIDFTSANLITEEDHTKISKRSKVDNGDILYAMIGTVGNPAIVNTDTVFSIKNVGLIKFREDSQIYNRYLIFALDSDLVKRQILRESKGGTQKFVSLKVLRNLKIPLPPLQVQKQIAAVLEKADTLRSQCQQMEQELNTLAQSVFLDMFGDPAKNSKSWPMGVIGDCCASVNYGTSDKADIENGAYPVLRMNNITYEGRWNFSSLKYLDLDEKGVEKYLAESGDILFNRTNSKELVGKTAVYRESEPMAFAGYLVRARVNDKAVPEYISALMNSRYGKQTLLNMCKSIVGMANINAKEFQKIKLPIPPIELQQEFQKIVFALDEKLFELKKHFKENDDLFNSLMQKAFKGELELKDVA
ncbi:Type-1 restriction enzyme EcoKI specificity protein [Pseudoalteromonas sp. CIP111854]|uniref:Type-1 restriction enzyme EcoKI specificity protein n=1 Tax=Pseudoalteromonas holothuriae TaxID=2963714 RepID=A0A9W4VWP8_9GAMM|nr:restriction endonuclease subunit S [Pseudoalteromonas sp. CIP111854]CAH9060292.1 Type-1 restriction enzyme EcoKI specificity protein [Pseudoalteromonas sp. CIP111854]